MIKGRDRRDANNILKAITSSCTPKRSRDLPGLEVSSSCISASLSASPISSRYLKHKKGKKMIFKFNRYSSGNFFEKKTAILRKISFKIAISYVISFKVAIFPKLQFPLFQNSNLTLFPTHIICIDQQKYLIKRINIIISFKIAILFQCN